MPRVDHSTDGPVAVPARTREDAAGASSSLGLDRELDVAFPWARFDDFVHVIVPRGAGERVFCADAGMVAMLGSDVPGHKDYFGPDVHDARPGLDRSRPGGGGGTSRREMT